jgi:hypothetical protein
MAEGNRLRDLQVGEAGQCRGRFLFSKIEQPALEFAEQDGDVVDCITQIETNVGGNLIVA